MCAEETFNGLTSMKSHWHETIQMYVDGQSSAEVAAALFDALNKDAEVRALFLDYMNLDMALGAVADGVAVEENGSNRMISLHEVRVGAAQRLWRWAAATAMAALFVFAMLPRVPKPVRTGQDVSAAISSSQNAIARLALDTPSALPAWMSPTASLLEPPTIPQ
jgi:anti-sigma factor RsiW